jgi:uncharacterized membrane protein
MAIGMLLFVIPAIILAFMFWPTYFVIVDGKAGLLESFGVASKIAANNYLTIFLVWLTSAGLMLLGVVTCGIGLLFVVPLVSVLLPTAYLMMSGQIPAKPQFAGLPYGQGGYPQQPIGPPGAQFPAPGWQPPTGPRP